MVVLPELNIFGNNMLESPYLLAQLVGTITLKVLPRSSLLITTPQGRLSWFLCISPEVLGLCESLCFFKTACTQREWRHSRTNSLADLVAEKQNSCCLTSSFWNVEPESEDMQKSRQGLFAVLSSLGTSLSN